jgi:hypothetical protein
MTDFLQGLINNGHKLQSIIVQNGWLELDTIHDYNLYEKLKQSNSLNFILKLTKLLQNLLENPYLTNNLNLKAFLIHN